VIPEVICSIIEPSEAYWLMLSEPLSFKDRGFCTFDMSKVACCVLDY
jgi:hypothetical protein